MAGKPHSRACAAALEKLASRQDMDPLEYVCARIASGDYLATIAKEIDVSRTLFSTHVNSLPGAKAALKEARSDGAHALREEAQQIADEVEQDKDAIAKARLQIDTRLWAAQRLNRAEFGGDSAPQVNVNLNGATMFLDAMRVRRVDATPARARLIEAPPADENAIDDAIVEPLDDVSDDTTTT